jgi:hypothetical protein
MAHVRIRKGHVKTVEDSPFVNPYWTLTLGSGTLSSIARDVDLSCSTVRSTLDQFKEIVSHHNFRSRIWCTLQLILFLQQ